MRCTENIWKIPKKWIFGLKKTQIGKDQDLPLFKRHKCIQ